jgi:flagellar biogenesis protein FliO
MPGYASYLVETMVTLLLVCGAAALVLLGARKVGIGRASGPLTLMGQLPLDARRSVYLIKVADKVLVVGASEGGMVKLAELAAGDVPVLEQAAAPKSFAEVLARLKGKS